MAGDDACNDTVYTTSEADRQAVAALQKRIAESNATSSTQAKQSRPSDWTPVPSVSIAEGAHKYVLISATEPYPQDGEDECYTSFVVTSKEYAQYHQIAAEPYVELLEARGYKDINVTGGGRIRFEPSEKKIAIYGYSYGFGLADHACSKMVIEKDERYKGYDVTWSNEGY